MRNTTISSSFASSVTQVAVDCVAIAGIAVRTFLHLTYMRESMGYWRELCQSEIARRSERQHYHGGNLKPGNKPGPLPHFGTPALAVCPAPFRLAAVRQTQQG